jgi:DNA polymerase elongation subunit (family B)
MQKITSDQIDAFLAGKNPIERVINIECAYGDEQVKITARKEDGRKYTRHFDFYPFLWAKFSACDAMCGGNRDAVKKLLAKYGIKVVKLVTNFGEGVEEDRIKNGYKYMFRAKVPMSYSKFLKFFKEAGVPVYSDRDENDIPESRDESRKYLTVTPVEQYMISSGTRLFKGYDTYDDVYRMEWDLETEGLVAKRHRINQIGVRTNKGFEKIIPVKGDTKEELDRNEFNAIVEFLQIIAELDPDVIVGYNTENFDWPFIIERCQVLGVDFFELSKEILGRGIYKNQKPTTLKLGGEVETFYQTVVPGYIILDGLHAARRAQAGDSNMLKADLKYVTKYLSLNKPNRVYVPGDRINKTWLIETPDYGFNNDNGDWYRMTGDVPLKDGYVPTTGRYIVERYLLDDLWETDKVELQLNQANFLINKIVPTGFARACTMGTAGIWKLIALAWSYEQGLAVPAFGPGGRFTGGLSRLCRTGYVRRVIKLDYNSLYPSIMLTWFIDPSVDIQAVLPAMLNYVLTQREKYKKLKKEGAKNAEKLREEYKKTGNEALLPQIQHWENVEMLNDRLQNPLKILGNSAFGSFGAENLFPLGSKECAERITCTGRQALRLMISWFMNIGYIPIVGDTDGFNFALPETFRYTDEHPYISTGKSRETKEGVAYTGYKADVAEFNDMFMCDMHYHVDAINKMGLGIDEIVESTINFSRKNYADYFPENPYPKDVKLVGNTIKSKKMPGYIAKFLDKGIRLLLQNKGSEFLDYYYDYVEKIYNYQIPLKDIASKGKIKKSIDEYIKDTETLTKAGRPKSRQAWYELCIKDGLKPDIGETIYYINTGSKKSESDIKKVTKWYEYTKDGEKIDRTKEVEKGAKQWRKDPDNEKRYKDSMSSVAQLAKPIYPEIEWMKENGFHYQKEYELVFACELLDQNIIDSEDDVFCEDGKEYNVSKYIDMFNKRITPLLVCFSKDIRDKILITDPKDRQYFTKEESTLVSGEPDAPGDQDDIEDVLRMEDREVKFWIEHPEWIPPYTKECGMDWEAIKTEYLSREEEERKLGIDKIREQYEEIVENMSQADVTAFMNGNPPKNLMAIVEPDPKSSHFLARDFPGVVIGNVMDIMSKYVPVEEEAE